MDRIGGAIVAVVSAIIGVAVIALMVSPNAQTASVFNAFFGGLSNLIGVAISPVTGRAVAGLSAAGLTGGNWSAYAAPGTSAYTMPASSGSGGSFALGGQNGFIAVNNVGGILTGAANLASGIGGLFGGTSSGDATPIYDAANTSAGPADSAWAGQQGDPSQVSADLQAAGW